MQPHAIMGIVRREQCCEKALTLMKYKRSAFVVTCPLLLK
jgi:hypothetical protein